MFDISAMPCQPPKTNADRTYSIYYSEYYRGDRDNENRKDGQGEHHWSGAKSLESYEGQMLQDTMHGTGQYRIRYQGGNHAAVTYEGWFYNNNLHGYGVMSYSDGRIYNGLFYNNVRWGPGVVSHAALREDVGFWSGTQLVRLAWRPSVPSVAIDLTSSPIGEDMIKPYRSQLCSNVKIIGEANSAIELLKQYGADPLTAEKNWTKLYPKNCTDTKSQLCNVQAFDRSYYDKQINMLSEITDATKKDEQSQCYFAWNNNETIIHMMKHCYKHAHQRTETKSDLQEILWGNRNSFKPPDKHEIDCRALLMVSYLGYIANVAQLVNECDVNSNVTDVQGNSPIMYAACGDQPEIIHFLNEAGANIDYYNDACCTPLGVTLLRYALACWEIVAKDALQVLLPSSPEISAESQTEEPTLEWKIKRFIPIPPMTRTSISLQRTESKISKVTKLSQKNLGSTSNLVFPPDEAEEIFKEQKQVYRNISDEYNRIVNEIFSTYSYKPHIPYLFEVVDMAKEVIFSDDDKKSEEPSKAVSKGMKGSGRPSREIDGQTVSKSENIFGDKIQTLQDKLDQIMSTILQLVSDGADPRKVCCPHPALFIATVAGSARLIDLLVEHGANVNELYPKALGYSPIDIAVNGPLSYNNLEVIRSLLKNGAKVDHRLSSPFRTDSETELDEGPTLLHLVLMKKLENDTDEDVRQQLLELLLEYGCDPILQCMGRSAVDVAMSKNMDLLDIFVKSPATDLNAPINSYQQNILMKMFHVSFSKKQPLSGKLQTLTNLLLFGADPLLKCQYGQEQYANLFVYANKILSEMTHHHLNNHKISSATTNKSGKDAKNPEKKKTEKLVKKSLVADGDYGDYKQTLDLVMECARLLYIRWLQAKLLKELIEVVNKYIHRHWNLILKDYKSHKSLGLWVNTARALEIFDILKTAKRKLYKDNRIKKAVLCIVHYYHKKTRNELEGPIVTSSQKAQVEREVAALSQEHKLAAMSTPEVVPTLRPYVAPELTTKGLEKFNICFECAMPLVTLTTILCSSCKMVSFCSLACVRINVERPNCHPCSFHLKNKYFSSIGEEASEVLDDYNFDNL